MTIIMEDNKIRNVKLTGDEIGILIETLEREPYNVYRFFNYGKIIKQLNDAKKK